MGRFDFRFSYEWYNAHIRCRIISNARLVMSVDVAREFLHHLDEDGEFAIGHSPPAVAAWLDQTDLPWELGQLLRFYWPQQNGYVRHLRLDAASDILKNPDLEKLLHRRIVPIGSAPNGDPLVIRCDGDRLEVGFLSHEIGDGTVKYQPIARTIESLLYRLMEGRYVPTDYHSAKAFNAFLAAERGSQ